MVNVTIKDAQCRQHHRYIVTSWRGAHMGIHVKGAFQHLIKARGANRDHNWQANR